MLKKTLTYCFICVSSLLCAETFRTEQWEITELLWNWGVISSSCNVGVMGPRQYFTQPPFDPDSYSQIKRGDIVWVKSGFLQFFYDNVFHKIQNPFILVVGIGDESFPSDCLHGVNIDDFIQSENIVHIYAQNYDYKGTSKKVTPIPIGVDFHTVAYATGRGSWGETGSPLEQEARLKEILSTLSPTHLRKKRAFVDFQWNDTLRCGSFGRHGLFGECRSFIFADLLQTGLIDYSNEYMKRSDLWKMKGQYAFSICPAGNGLDTHRTWEDLLLGCIVIVKTCPLDPLYKGLPVVIIKNWSEITEENLEKWLIRYGDAFTNPSYREKLTNAYWINKIRSTPIPE
ncbi:MAG TPA: hypothetical protein VLE96_03260 [Chlamydiales bacterium]|nr:hypothetical protein [Chlamydiales bacterium]